jgi:hypothetical protein
MNITDFKFEFKGYGHYLVTYTSPVTGKQWKKTIFDMSIIDKTKGEEYPKKKDIIMLKKLCKS